MNIILSYFKNRYSVILQSIFHRPNMKYACEGIFKYVNAKLSTMLVKITNKLECHSAAYLDQLKLV